MAIWTNFEVDIYTPTVSNVTISIPGDIVEINAGGIQVVRNDTRYVRINKSGTSNTMLTVGGDITATGNITAYFGSTSDVRLKENIIPIEFALEKIEKINGVYFDWKDEYIKEKKRVDDFKIDKRDVGVIAQEIEEILPEIVIQKENGYKTVKYEKIVPLLIQAIKELRDEIRKLKQ